jgi:aldehyde:ferredoxin oxidoreductase
MVAAEVPAGCHPLGRHNKLVIAPGALSGTEAPNSGRLSIGLKSPLTGGIKESNVGGTAAYRLGRLGLAAIVIEGLPHEERPYLLVVTKDGGRLISCSAYRGLKNYELVKALHTAYGEKAAILSVGPAGEMMLPVATVACTDTAGLPCRHAGRGGTGAVMGAKGLKAIIIDDADGPGVTIADAEKFRQGAKRLAKALRDHPLTGQALRLLGTNLFAGAIDAAGAYPTRNFRRGTFEGIDRVSGEYMYEVITRRGGKPSRAGCSLCTIECSNVYLDEQGGYITSALEYGTIWAHGANLDISDLDSIAKADRLCDDYGIDTLEIGQAIGVAMEAGIKQFGDAPGALELIEEVGRGTSLGKILGNGAWATGRAFGATRIPCVKRQAMAAYDPRAIHGMGVTYATSPMGADHTAGWVVHTNLVSMGGTLDPHNPDGQVDNCRRVQVFTAAMDCTGLCNFTHLPIVGTDEGKESFLSMMNGLYGKEFAFEDIMTLGKELLETEHGFNLAAGFTRADDRLPEFMKEETLPPHNVKFTVPDDELDRFWGEFR